MIKSVFGDKMKDMTSGNPLKLILTFAIPVLLGNLFQQFYLMADTMIVGQLLGVNELAAMGTSTVVANFVIGMCMGMAMGVCVLVAQFYGAKDETAMKQATAGAYAICISAAILFCIVSLLLASPILQLLKTPKEIFNDANCYLMTLMAGIMITMLYNLFSSLLRAVGDSKTPLYFLIIASITNIILDYGFIQVVSFGMMGAALATVLSQLLATILCYFYIRKHYAVFLVKKDDFCFEKTLFWKQFTMGISIGLMNSIVSIGTIVLQSGVNSLGKLTIAAHTAARKVVEMFMQPLMSLSIAITTFISQNMGAKKWDRIRESLKKGVWIAMAWVMIVIIISHTCVQFLFSLLVSTSQSEVIEIGSFYTRVMSLFYGPLAILFIYRGALQ